jgi:hypothetical protein
VEERTAPVCEASVEALSGARAFFGRVPDWRKKIGDFNGAGLIALVACASLCGVQERGADYLLTVKGAKNPTPRRSRRSNGSSCPPVWRRGR